MAVGRRPALTPEEWREKEFESRYGVVETSLQVDHNGRLFATSGDPASPDFVVVILNETRDRAPLHKTASLCLHGQPFGFGRADVGVLRELARDCWAATALESLASRIEALLPPEDGQ